jgi:hypothetical protein
VQLIVQIVKHELICKPIAIVPVHTTALPQLIKVTTAIVPATVTAWYVRVRVGKNKLGKLCYSK